MAEKKEKEEKVQLGPTLREGEIAIGVCHIFASFNDTFIHVTDLSGSLDREMFRCFLWSYTCILQ